jgi:hypothetical protein
MSQTLLHWRCFWRWPPGHKWEQVSDAGLAYRRCVNCGLKEGSDAGYAGNPHDRFGGGSGGGGEAA